MRLAQILSDFDLSDVTFSSVTPVYGGEGSWRVRLQQFGSEDRFLSEEDAHLLVAALSDNAGEFRSRLEGCLASMKRMQDRK